MADKYFNNDKNIIVILNLTNQPERTTMLVQFINSNIFSKFLTYSFHYSLVKDFLYLKHNRNRVASTYLRFQQDVDVENFKRFVYFSDNPPIIQKILGENERRDLEYWLVEEGTALYINNEHFPLKDRIKILFDRYVYGSKHIKLYSHGRGGYAHTVVAREPNLMLIPKVENKIQDDFVGIFANSNENRNSKEVTEKGYLLAPTPIYTKEPTLKYRIIKDVLHHFVTKRKKVYLKEHPSDANDYRIQLLVQKFTPYVEIINNVNLTAEDLLVNDNIIGVISDTSSVLVSAYYYKKRFNLELEIISYYNIVKERYNFDLGKQLVILDYLIENNDIKLLDLE
jgi:hypothetical protein